MIKNIAKLLVVTASSLCFTVIGFVHAGSSAKVTDEDKKAVEEVSETQKNNEAENRNTNIDAKNVPQKEDNESKETTSEEKQEASSNFEEQKESTENKESNQFGSEDGSAQNEQNNKNENVEEMTEAALPEPKNGDWYSQELSEESKKILKDFDALVAELIEHMKNADKNESQVQYRREKANEFFTNHFGTVEEIASVEDITVKSSDGYEIPVRVYKIAEQPSKNLLMYVHGGGWTQGNVDTHGYLCRKLAKTLNMDVISVDYRLAPENPYPIPLNDVLSVYKHYVEEQKYQNIVISGDSAGGNLCAALCIKINDEGLKQPYAQVLLYPPLGNDFESKSYETFGECMALSKVSTMGFLKNYAGKELSDDEISSNKFIYPLLESNMKIFPKTMIISSGYDVLLDGQLRFAEGLRQNEVFVYHIVNEGAVHGFMTFGDPYDSLVTENCQKIKKFLGNMDKKSENEDEAPNKEENDEK